MSVYLTHLSVGLLGVSWSRPGSAGQLSSALGVSHLPLGTSQLAGQVETHKVS